MIILLQLIVTCQFLTIKNNIYIIKCCIIYYLVLFFGTNFIYIVSILYNISLRTKKFITFHDFIIIFMYMKNIYKMSDYKF